ncbi:MAG: TadE/TadG family type IV pilus assembly protein [Polymorphobacter sp.]
MEFALLLPLMTLMLAATMQYGVLMFTYNAMLNTARNGARAMAAGSSTEAEVITTAKANLPKWVPTAKWKIVPQNEKTTKSDRVTARITVDSQYATVLPLAPMPSEIEVFVVMLKEK